MKPVFKCDYCSEMGTEEEIREHESKCFYNYNKKSCFTCMHKAFKGCSYECKVGVEIPEGKIIEFCQSYEREEENSNIGANLFGKLFGFGL